MRTSIGHGALNILAITIILECVHRLFTFYKTRIINNILYYHTKLKSVDNTERHSIIIVKRGRTLYVHIDDDEVEEGGKRRKEVEEEDVEKKKKTAFGN